MDSNGKALSGLSYLSVFFMPFFLPIIVYFGSKDVETKRHAKRAFISHLLTIALSVFFVVIMLFTFVNTVNRTLNISLIILFSILFIFCIAAFIGIFIWNIVQAVKVIR